MDVKNAIYPAPEQAMAFFGLPEDGPFVMVNLLKFKPKAEYPSLAAFRSMATSPEYHAIEHHRIAGLAGQLNIRTKPRD